MENKKRLIWDEDAKRRIIALATGFHTDRLPVDMVINVILHQAPTVDAVPVDDIRIHFSKVYLEGQEVVLNVTICGKPTVVRMPFDKDIAEVVHGRWLYEYDTVMSWTRKAICSACKCVVAQNVELAHEYGKENHEKRYHYCPNCGAKMDLEG